MPTRVAQAPAAVGYKPILKRLAAGMIASLALSTLILSQDAEAERLRTDFDRALQHDPEFQSAIAQRDAGVETLEQARAQLLPQASSNLQRSQNNTDSRTQTLIGPSDRSFSNYPAVSASLQVRQALYRPKAWANLAQGKAEAQYAELNLLAARQDLATRLMGIHAEWAAAGEALASAQASVQLQMRLAEQLQQLYRAGDGTRTDVEVAKARIVQAQSAASEASINVENSRLAWMQMTGQPGDAFADAQASSVQALRLREHLADDLPLMHASSERWQEAAREHNPVLRAQREALESARQEVRKAQSEHLPAADLFAARSYSKSAMDNTIGTEFRTAQVGIQISVPIYAGGAVNSMIRQAQANARRVENELLASTARMNLQIDRDWHTLMAARADATAQRRSIEALKVVIDAAVKGLGAGISTRMDEDQAMLQLLNARRDLARANARALFAWSRLMASLGGLSEASLTDVEPVIDSGSKRAVFR
ncbi:MAG TPA: hypothetical protein DCE31_11740 [Lautropia sp.]|nr:hypothetical protein [Lautropia sp.]